MTSYKLSSNENPYPPLPGVVEAATRAVETMNRYPDMGSAALYDALAERLAVPDRAPGRGDRLGRADLPAPRGVLRARRRGRPRLALLRGLPDRGGCGRGDRVPVPVTADGRHDLDAMAAAVTDRTRVVIVCTPNNPTGPAVTQTELEAFLDQDPERTWSWSSTRPTSSSCGWMTRSTGWRPRPRHPNVVLFRTFSKAYGLAGFRVGLRRCPTGDRRRPARGVAAVRGLGRGPGGRDRVPGRRDAAPRAGGRPGRRARPGRRGPALSRVGRPRGAGQLLLVGAPGRRGDRTAEFAAAADERGIVVRPFAGEGCRVSVGEVEANDLLIALAGAWDVD